LNIKTIYLYFALLASFILNSQIKSEPVAKFSFNNKSNKNDISGQPIKLVGVNYTSDRFGNENNAVFFSGNKGSYVNLGTYKSLKHRVASISLWVKIEHPDMSGTGAKYNPIIITKCNPTDDFYESYAMYYMLESKKLVAACAKDSTRDIGIFSKDTAVLNKWLHLVMTYNEEEMSFYVNGELQGSFHKNFETKFLEGDSVIVGLTANKKNNRWLIGSVDDIEFYDKVLTLEEIRELYKADDPNKDKLFLHKLLFGLGLFLFIICLIFTIRYYIKFALKKEKERLELSNKLLENELRIHRALMNPHFIFNSLNTLNHYILTNNNEVASDYLVKFSKLIRKILDSNLSDTILLEQEIELIHRYLEIESLRFKENIMHQVIIDPAIVSSSITIPIMMVQPFIENSVWHGLRDKIGEKTITVTFLLHKEKYILCIIEDNGTGRKMKEQTLSGKKSLATSFVSQRLELLNKIHNLNCTLNIIDKENNQGTIVEIVLPILNK